MTLILNNDEVRRVLTRDEGVGREIPTEWLTQEFHT